MRHCIKTAAVICCVLFVAVTSQLSCLKTKLDILFIFDSSNDVGNPDFVQELMFAANLAENFNIGTSDVQFAGITFGTSPQTIFNFNSFTEYTAIQTEILNTVYQGGLTNTHLALETGLNLFDVSHGSRPGTPKVAIVFTSGRSSDSQKTRQQAAILRQAGVYVIVVGLANSTVVLEQQAIASDPTVVFNNNFNGVLNSLLTYSNTMCNQEIKCSRVQFADVIFVLDSSASISDPDYTSQLQFVSEVTDKFTLGPADVQFGAVIFSTDTVKLFDLKDFTNHDPLKIAITSAAHLKSGTDTAKALDFVYQQGMYGAAAGGRANATKILIIMTDGRSNSLVDTVKAADRLKSVGVRFISIGIGQDIDLNELFQLAGDNHSLFTVPGYSALQEIQNSVTKLTCEMPNDPITAPCLKGKLDILFIFDSSNDVGNPGFIKELMFASNLAENFNIGTSDVQFAGITFGTSPQTIFNFNSFTEYTAIQTAILNATFEGGLTNTHLALETGLHFFDPSHGSRPGSPRIAIVFTNGRSSDTQKTKQQAEILRQAGVYVIVVGLASSTVVLEQQVIASDPTLVFNNNFNGVLNALQTYSNNTCNKEIICRVQFADVIFVLDSSASISDPDYKSQLQFVSEVTEKFTLGPADVQFGAVIFSTDTVKLFDLKDFTNHDPLKSAITSAAHLKSGTDTAKALDFVYQQDMYGAAAGGRANATKILIIMTDGRSNSLVDTVKAADRLKSVGVRFISIGIGQDIDLNELFQLAGDNHSLFTVPGYSALQEIQNSVTKLTCESPKTPVTVSDSSHLCLSFRWADGMHPNPYDCSTYIQCQSFITSIISCQPSEAYDPIMQHCTDKFVAHPCDDPAFFGPIAI